MSKVVYLNYYGDTCALSYNQLLQNKFKIADIWLCDNPQKDWGDGWNDAPHYCNAGSPYANKCKNLRIIEVRLGDQLPTNILGVDPNYCESQRPQRDVVCQKTGNHKGKHRAVVFWE